MFDKCYQIASIKLSQFTHQPVVQGGGVIVLFPFLPAYHVYKLYLY